MRLRPDAPHAEVFLGQSAGQRLTTEGGPDVGQRNARARDCEACGAGIRVSLFIAAAPDQIEMAARLRSPVIEIHTGAWCDALAAGRMAAAEAELARIREGAKLAARLGLEVHAGHGLNYETAETIAALPEFVELTSVTSRWGGDHGRAWE